MGVTFSRPLQQVEYLLLGAASAWDSLLRKAERGINVVLHGAFGPLFGFERPSTIHRACDADGVCYIPASQAAKARAKRVQRAQDKIAKRAARAEAAARNAGAEFWKVKDLAEQGAKDAWKRAGEKAEEDRERLVKAVEHEKERVRASMDIEKDAIHKRYEDGRKVLVDGIVHEKQRVVDGVHHAGQLAHDQVHNLENAAHDVVAGLEKRAHDQMDKLLHREEQTKDRAVQALEQRKAAITHAIEKKQVDMQTAIDERKKELIKRATEDKERVVQIMTRSPKEDSTTDQGGVFGKWDIGAGGLAAGLYAGLAGVAQYGAEVVGYVAPKDLNTSPARDENAIKRSLGEDVKAPRPRSAEERQTAAEKSKGQLWVMGNVAPSSPPQAPLRRSNSNSKRRSNQPQPTESSKAGQASLSNSDEKTDPNEAHASPRKRANAPRLDAVRESMTFPDQVQLYSHERRGSGADAAHFTYQVLAKSGDSAPVQHVVPRERKSSKNKSKDRNVAIESCQSPDSSSAPSPAVNAAPVLVAPKPRRAQAETAPFVEPRKSAPASLVLDANVSSSTAVGAGIVRGATPSSIGGRMSKAARASFDSIRVALPGSPGPLSDSESALGGAGPAASPNSPAWSRSNSPALGVCGMADKACLSRLEASKKERKAWKDEVQLQLCNMLLDLKERRAQKDLLRTLRMRISAPTPSHSAKLLDVSLLLSLAPRLLLFELDPHSLQIGSSLSPNFFIN
ncbi:hypothetical protein CBOM_00667 [Ceraceosorus bombacis]|uniref:Uncharacterized protein n=1 Tax=Ceraceosorus bombacis TaxID=401625 RepID=A0A0P1BAQ3_9BASI|nr:hypothetical protein CBOM_00667 [Ceraceosorus bombacis]